MNRTVVITGSTSGIGSAFADLFADRGDALILVSRNVKTLRAQCMTLSERHPQGRFSYIVADLSDHTQVDAVCRRLADEPVDVLVNNAGFGMTGPFIQEDPRGIRSMIDVNVAAPTALARIVAEGMVTRGHGRILNVASIAAFMPNPFGAVYAATKAYVLSLSEALSEELRGTGVTVTALCPGPTSTHFAERSDMGRTRVFARNVMDAESVARAGYRGMMRGRRRIVPGIPNRIVTGLSIIVPTIVVLRIAAWALKYKD